MKTLNFLWALPFLLAATLLVSCEKNQAPTCQFLKPADASTITKGETVTVSINAEDADGLVSEVRLYINEEGLASLEFPYQYSLNTEELRSGSYTLKVTARDDEGLESSDEVEIIVDAAYSIVTTGEATSITYNSALAGGEVKDDGGGEITDVGVFWDTISSPQTAGKQVSLGQGLGEFSGTLTDLPDGTQIFYMAYAENSAGISVGEIFSFVSHTTPTVQTNPIESYDYASALVGGEVTADGGEALTETGIYWSSEPNAEETGTRLSIENTAGIFSATLENLSPFTSYYIKAFALNAAGESLGEEQSFTTSGPATVNTLEATSKRYKSMVLSGEISENGGNEVTESGFYYGTSPNSASSGTRVPVESETASFNSTLSDLIPGSTYYYTAFAVNGAGESTGEEMSYKLPEVEEGTLNDPRDQKVYSTVKIGEQVWMSENLKATVFNDGAEILQISDSADWNHNTGPAYCWYEDDPQWKENGALYTWYTINTGKLCPAGWHVPSDTEWRQLEYYLGMEEEVSATDGYRGTNEGGMLKTTELWNAPNTGATDELLFSVEPSGRRGYRGEFAHLYTATFFWSNEIGVGNEPLVRVLWNESGQISRTTSYKNNGYSVRCLQDE